VGSLLAGDEETIREARRVRKAFGGGMRQAGVIAAFSLYAFEHHVARLAEDHERASKLAEGLIEAGYRVEPPETNIVLVDVGNAEKFLVELAEKGVLALPRTASTIRFVTHLNVGDEEVDAAVKAAAGLAAHTLEL
jgi:threonine aldolase